MLIYNFFIDITQFEIPKDDQKFNSLFNAESESEDGQLLKEIMEQCNLLYYKKKLYGTQESYDSLYNFINDSKSYNESKCV